MKTFQISKQRRVGSKASPPPDQAFTSSIPCTSKIITIRRYVSFTFLHEEGFSIGENLAAIGLEKLYSLNLPTYLNLVREFFGTTTKTSNGVVGTVRGTTITTNEEILGSLLGITTSSSKLYQLEHRDKGLNKVLSRDDCSPCQYISTQDLEAESRLLLSIIGRALFSKIGHFEFILEHELAFMYHVLETILFNMAFMMVTYIGEAIGKNRFSLLYTMVFTLLFRKLGLGILTNESIREFRHTGFYNEGTLHRMGYSK